MSIHMGIMCEQCRRVHFIATSSAIQFSRLAQTYLLRCPPPCATVWQFQEHLMLPYRVGEEVFSRSYAVEGEYELVRSVEGRIPRYLTAHA